MAADPLGGSARDPGASTINTKNVGDGPPRRLCRRSRSIHHQRKETSPELARPVAVDHVSEHLVVCRSEPAGEKRGEGETATGQQPPQVKVCEATTSSL
jgi:hypothetical protein